MATPPKEVQAEAGVELSRVRYTLSLDASGTTKLDEGRGFRLKNELGTVFEVRALRVTSLSASLLPCTPAPPSAPKTGGAFRMLNDALGVPPVFAGHSEQSDPSEVHEAMSEDFVNTPAVHPFGERSFRKVHYCRVHYLVARAKEQSALSVKGRALEAGREPTDLALEVGFANSALRDLAGITEGKGQTAHVSIDRSLGGLFRGVSPSTMSQRDLARVVLTNLIDGTRITVRLE